MNDESEQWKDGADIEDNTHISINEKIESGWGHLLFEREGMMWGSFNSQDGSSLKVTGKFISRERHFIGVRESERVHIFNHGPAIQGIFE